jgi:hypothetical protein
MDLAPNNSLPFVVRRGRKVQYKRLKPTKRLSEANTNNAKVALFKREMWK